MLKPTCQIEIQPDLPLKTTDAFLRTKKARGYEKKSHYEFRPLREVREIIIFLSLCPSFGPPIANFL